MISHSQVRAATPLVAAAFTLPSWYRSLVEHSAPVEQSLIRFAVALPVAWLLLTLFRMASSTTPVEDEAVPAEDSGFDMTEFDPQSDPF